MAQTTANKEYSFDMKLCNTTLASLVTECHKFYTDEINKTLVEEKKWKYGQIYPGQYGYDAIAIPLAYTIMKMKKDDTDYDLAILIHDAWTINYVYWRDNKPYDHDTLYKKPYNGIEDERRNKCASSTYNELNNDEKNKDLIIAKFIKSKIM